MQWGRYDMIFLLNSHSEHVKFVKGLGTAEICWLWVWIKDSRSNRSLGSNFWNVLTLWKKKTQCDADDNCMGLLAIVWVLGKINWRCQATAQSGEHHNIFWQLIWTCFFCTFLEAVWGPVNHLERQVCSLWQQTEKTSLLILEEEPPLRKIKKEEEKKMNRNTCVNTNPLQIWFICLCSSVPEVNTPVSTSSFPFRTLWSD